MTGLPVTPDGRRYLTLASGERVARPFHYRWLVPTVAGTSPTNWRAVSRVSGAALCAFAYLHGGTGWRGLFVVGIAAGLTGVIRFNLRYPVLVDLPAMAFALGATVAADRNLWPVAIGLVLLAGATKETAPMFAALWAWHPVLLVGLIVPAIRTMWRTGPDPLDAENRWILEHPVAASRKYHRGVPTWVWILPWGAALVGLADPTVAVVVTVAVAYAQCAIATDTVRLYQWAWPTLAVAAADVVPPEWYLPVLLLHFANPFATEGG